MIHTAGQESILLRNG